jgi:hypothetical protein
VRVAVVIGSLEVNGAVLLWTDTSGGVAALVPGVAGTPPFCLIGR